MSRVVVLPINSIIFSVQPLLNLIIFLTATEFWYFGEGGGLPPHPDNSPIAASILLRPSFPPPRTVPEVEFMPSTFNAFIFITPFLY